MFKILGSDQKEYGPVNADVVRQWIADGRANAQTMVQAEGTTEFKPLSQLPEFQAALAGTSSAPGAQPIPPQNMEPTSNSLATTSLVLGILSLCLAFLTGIPAIITGHMALNRIRREPYRYGGKGPATAGLVLGYISLALTMMVIPAGLLLPALAKAKGKAQTISCVNNMKQIGLAARMYANDHNELFPPNFMAMSNELNTPKILVCPGDSTHVRSLDWANFSESANLTYEYLRPGAHNEETPGQPVFRCPIHNNVGFGDGSVMQSPRGRQP